MKTSLLIILFILSFSICEKNCAAPSLQSTEAPESSCKIEPYLREIFSQDLGYTLLGEKPISFINCYRLKFSGNTKQSLFEFLKSTFKDSPTFILKIFDDPDFPHNIVLIHKQALHRTIVFQPLLRECIRSTFGDEKEFFRDLQNPDKDVFSSFSQNPVLLGIALGYGRGNSEFFARRCLLGNYLNKLTKLTSSSFIPKPSPLSFRPAQTARLELFLSQLPCHLDIIPHLDTTKFHSLEQEWEWIEENCVCLKYAPPPVLFQFPIFIACKSKETDEIIQRFTLARTRLIHLFKNKQYRDVLAQEAQNMKCRDMGGDL